MDIVVDAGLARMPDTIHQSDVFRNSTAALIDITIVDCANDTNHRRRFHLT